MNAPLPGVTDILLDRDGTVIADAHDLGDPAGVALLPGAAEALARLSRAGLNLYLVTNQSGIGRGYYREDDFRAVQERLAALLEPFGAKFTDVAHCPHAPTEPCGCRKPRTGMWERLRDAHGLRADQTVMIGDKSVDVGFGHACGLAESVLVLTGYGQRAADRLGLPPISEGCLRLAPSSPEHPTLLAKDLPCALRALFGGYGS